MRVPRRTEEATMFELGWFILCAIIGIVIYYLGFRER